VSEERETEPRHLKPTGVLRAVLGPPRPLEPRWTNLAGYVGWKVRALARFSEWRWWLWLIAFLASGVTGVWDRDLPAVAVFFRSAALSVIWFFLPFAFDGLQVTLRAWWQGRKRV